MYFKQKKQKKSKLQVIRRKNFSPLKQIRFPGCWVSILKKHIQVFDPIKKETTYWELSEETGMLEQTGLVA